MRAKVAVHGLTVLGSVQFKAGIEMWSYGHETTGVQGRQEVAPLRKNGRMAGRWCSPEESGREWPFSVLCPSMYHTVEERGVPYLEDSATEL